MFSPQMDRSQIMCSYCGVNYLTFYEFHQLHTQLARLEAELQELRQNAQKSKARCEELELSRLEWERELHLHVQRRAETREQNIREELEEKRREAARALRKEIEAKCESKTKEMEEEYQKMWNEREKQLKEELGELGMKKLKEQRDDLEKRAEDRQKVLSDELQKASKNSEDLRTNLQQLEERCVFLAFFFIYL